MSSFFSPNIGLEEPALGDYVNSWSTPVNANWSLIDQKFGSYTLISVTGGTLSPTVAQAAYAFLGFIGVLGSNQIVILPTTGFWFVDNNTTGAFTLIVKGSAGDTGIQIPTGGLPQLIYSTGTNALTPVNYANIVEGLGFTPANKAGDTFTGAVTVSAGGIGVTGGANVAGGLVVSSSGATVAGGLTVSTGTSTLSGGASISSGATVNGGLTVASGTAAFGVATATTPSTGNNTTNVATTSFVNAEITANVGTAYAALTYLAVGDVAIGSTTGIAVAAGSSLSGASITIYGCATTGGPAGGSSPSGTWLALGFVNATNSSATMFKRIA